jgi:hopanoid biosynthesis associated protein HpnK
MRRLIVNADDFGLTSSVNKAILTAHERGIVTSASLMTGATAFEEAVGVAGEHPRLGVGVHLTLVNGRPVSRLDQIPTLVTSEGRFYQSPFEFIARLLLGNVRIEEVYRELRAQVSRAQEAGVHVTHVDGHKHLHVQPQILDVVIQVVRQLGIRRIRLPLKSSSSFKRSSMNDHQPERSTPSNPGRTRQSLSQDFVHWLVQRAAKSGRPKLIEAQIRFPENFFGLFETGSITEPLLRMVLENLPDGASEIMCHPGYDDQELRQTGTRLTQQRQQELQALTSQAIIDLVKNTGVELINYGHIA